ncbi:MAG: 50S ribosomal protein L15 [Myxococcota bacterium]|nr:50S ribosomal protein L15 [Myxococcota bacterium]
MTLHNLHPNPGATKTKKRLGRGRGSGTGKTSGKGVKGQKARPGHHGARLAFEGGQVPMPRRIPKRGFKNVNRVEIYPVNVSLLETLFEAGATVDLAVLREKGLIPKRIDQIKILGEGELTKKLTIKAHRASTTAKEKIEKAGGSLEIVATAAPAATAA